MKTVKIGRHKVTYYDAISELPIVRFHVYNKMLLVDSGVGSDVTDFDSHIERVMAFLQKKDTENAVKELQNVRQNLYLIQQSLSPKHMAFAAIIKEIDAKERNNISEDGLKETLAMLTDATVKDVDSPVSEAKKKIDEELQLYFPNLFSDSAEKEYYDLILKRTKLVLADIIEDKDNKDDIDRITLELLTYTKPKDFASESLELAADKQFEKICLMLTENLHCEPKKMTVLEFYSAFDYLKERTRKSQRTNSQNR